MTVQLRAAHGAAMNADTRMHVLHPTAVLAAAVVSTALSVTGLAAVGTLPAADTSAADLVRWLQQHHNGVRLLVLLLTFNTPVLSFMLASLRRLLPGVWADMYLVGITMLLVTTSVQSWTWAALAMGAPDLDPRVAKTVASVAMLWGPVLTGATITMMLPVCVVALQGGSSLPRWLGVYGAVAIVEQAIEMITIFGERGFLAPGGPMNLQLGAGLVGVWMIAFAIWAGMDGRKHAAHGA
jgi:hypothetical protein